MVRMCIEGCTEPGIGFIILMQPACLSMQATRVVFINLLVP